MTIKHIDSPDHAPEQPQEVPESGLYVPQAKEIDVVSGASKGVKGKGGLSPYAQELLFNEEIIEVMVHESTNPNDENPIFVSVNGVPQYFFRGIPQQVKRKFVGVLAECKEHSISTPEYTAPDGSRAMGLKRASSLKYPFSVIQDKNPRGAAWLRSLLRAPT